MGGNNGAGIQNKIVFGQGYKLLPSSSQDITDMQQGTNGISNVNFVGNPEGSVPSNPGSLCHDPVSGNIYYKQSGSGNTGWFQLNAAAIASGIYGDGSDGSVTFDGSSVVLGITPSTNIYLLARDIFLDSSTINSGVIINTNGYRIFCNGTLTNNGTIQWNGSDGSNTGTGGVGTSNSPMSILDGSSINANGAGGGSCPGTVGGDGSTTTGNDGLLATSSSISFGGIGGNGGSGTNPGGNGGVLTNPSSTSPGVISIRSLPIAIICRVTFGGTVDFPVNSSTGGGGGGGDGVFTGGGGGGGGGIVIVTAFIFAGTGSIQANGGAGGDGAVGATSAGGGGGGGGGIVIVTSSSVISNSIPGQTIMAAGGIFGLGSGLGSNGFSGTDGLRLLFYSP